MGMKEQRLHVIRNIIQAETIRSQEELLNSLSDKGIAVTQATLSRDIKQLGIVKMHDDNGLYIYTLPDAMPSSENTNYIEPPKLDIEFSGNLAVLKTKPGYANAVAFNIDNRAPREILGTIAGDDTILIIPREGYTREQITAALVKFIE